jgi:hypothetical protein
MTTFEFKKELSPCNSTMQDSNSYMSKLTLKNNNPLECSSIILNGLLSGVFTLRLTNLMDFQIRRLMRCIEISKKTQSIRM